MPEKSFMPVISLAGALALGVSLSGCEGKPQGSSTEAVSVIVSPTPSSNGTGSGDAENAGPGTIVVVAEVRFDVPRPGCVTLRVVKDEVVVWDAVGPLVTDDRRAGSLPVRHLRLAGRLSGVQSKCGEQHPVFEVSAIVGVGYVEEK